MCLFSDILIMSFFQVQNLLQQMVSEYLLFLFFWYFIVTPFFQFHLSCPWFLKYFSFSLQTTYQKNLLHANTTSFAAIQVSANVRIYHFKEYPFSFFICLFHVLNRVLAIYHCMADGKHGRTALICYLYAMWFVLKSLYFLYITFYFSIAAYASCVVRFVAYIVQYFYSCYHI